MLKSSLYVGVQLVLAFCLVGSNALVAQEAAESNSVEGAVTHTFLVPNKDVKIEQEVIEDFNGVPVVIGIGSDGKGYFSPDLFPNIDPESVQAIGQIGKRLVLVTKNGDASYLTYDKDAGKYTSVGLGSGPVRLANSPKNSVIVRPGTAVASAPAVRVRALEEVDTSYSNYCPSSNRYAVGRTAARAQSNYNDARAEDGTIDKAKLSTAYELFESHYGSTSSINSAYFLAQMNFLGEVRKDYAKAMELFRRVESNGSNRQVGDAKYAMAIMLSEGGNGIERDPDAALRRLKEIKDARNLTAKSTFTAACLMLARTHARGAGTKVDLALSRKYIDEIKEMGGPVVVGANRMEFAINQPSFTLVR